MKYQVRNFFSLMFYYFSCFFSPCYNVFSTGFKSFSGHLKYEFLYGGYENSFWVAHSKHEYEEVSRVTKNVVKKYSLKYWYVMLKTKNIYISHNVSDVFPLCFKRGEVINFWHGIAIKHIGFDSLNEINWINKKLEKKISLPYDEWTFFYAQTEEHKKNIIKCFKINKNRIKVRQPLSIDFLSKEWLKNKENKENKENKTKVLYMPTFRNDGSDIEIINLSINKIKEYFFEQDIELILRCHPLIKLSNNFGFKGVSMDEENDPFISLSKCDLLVSDYSSVIYDFYFATSIKPILIQHDIEDYIRNNGGMYNIHIDCEYI